MLTQKQYNLLTFLLAFRKKNGVYPSYDEMRTFLGLKSKSSIHQIIHQLIERGYLRRLPNRARALEVIKTPPGGPIPSTGDNLRPVDHADSILNAPMVTLPLYGPIPAGTPMESFENEETIDVPHWAACIDKTDRTSAFALRVVGDSMKEAGILDGDLAILKGCLDVIQDGTIVAAVVDGSEVTLKRIFFASDHIILMPANRDFVPLTLAADRVQVQGCLYSVIRQYL